MGYYRAGFTDITGIDNRFMPRYPFSFIQADALEYLEKHGHEYDLIHSSPPCQWYAKVSKQWREKGADYPDLIADTRDLLIKTGKPYVIENVPDAPLINPLMLCGTMFGLDVIRHRLFETNPVIWFPPRSCRHYKPVVRAGRRPDLNKQFHNIVGHFVGMQEAKQAMGIDWMNRDELAEAVPPAYTEYVGRRMIWLIQDKKIYTGNEALSRLAGINPNKDVLDVRDEAWAIIEQLNKKIDQLRG